MNSINDANEQERWKDIDAPNPDWTHYVVLLTASQLVKLHAVGTEAKYRRRLAGSDTPLLQEALDTLTTALDDKGMPLPAPSYLHGLTVQEQMAVVSAALTHLNMMKIADPNAESKPEFKLLNGAIEKLKPTQAEASS